MTTVGIIQEKVSGYNITITMVREEGLTPRYTASVSCPVEGCTKTYTKQRQPYDSAAAVLKGALRSHFRTRQCPLVEEPDAKEKA